MGVSVKTGNPFPLGIRMRTLAIATTLPATPPRSFGSSDTEADKPTTTPTAVVDTTHWQQRKRGTHAGRY